MDLLKLGGKENDLAQGTFYTLTSALSLRALRSCQFGVNQWNV